MPSSTAIFQLVLQFEAHDLEDYDQLIRLEDRLMEHLPPEAKVDGHDMGAGEFNIFILTTTPVASFEKAKGILTQRFSERSFKAAYRALDSEQYLVVWPPRLKHFEIV